MTTVSATKLVDRAVVRLRSVPSNESRLGLAAFVVMVAGMITTPLFDQGGDERRVLALVVVAALFVCGLASAVYAHGRRAMFAALVIVVFTFLVEVLGSSTGFPFGSYDYSTALTPQLLDVPIVVSFAWAGITLVAHGAFGARVMVMAGAITAWDAFLDPQMVGEGYWQWQPVSVAYRGIPLVNYAGWLLTATITSLIAARLCGTARRTSTTLPRTVYATLAVLSTIGFTFFFDDLVVALVGGVAMGVFMVLSFKGERKRIA